MFVASLLSGLPLVWAQADVPAVPNWLLWFYTWGDPSVTIEGPLGGLLVWIKVVALFSLLGWAGSWVVTAIKERPAQTGLSRQPWLDLAALIALGLGLLAAFTWVLIVNKRLPASLQWAPTALGVLASLVIWAWLEVRLIGILMARGDRADRAVLVGLHAALLLGFAIGFLLQRSGAMPRSSWRDALFLGGRLGATYMGLVVLARLAGILLPELRAVRARRLYAVGWQSWVESFRRMFAPWVVLILFVVILAFANWFLQTPRQAELGRLYVYALMLLTSLLLSLLVVILTPISLPNDIRQQTIFTVVSKPVRRLELIWGRILGYQALVTLLVAIFGLISLAYYDNQIYAAIREADARVKAAEEARPPKVEFARQYREQANQLRTRMGARVPVYGSLIFFDSRGHERRHGIDVGIELPTRSFIEGATASRAIWRFGPSIPNPFNPRQLLDRTIPVDQMLRPGTIEYVANRALELGDRVAAAQQATGSANLKASDVRRLSESATEAQAELKRLQAELDNMRQREQALRRQGRVAQANRLHSPPIPIEMTFNVYRTTKGVVGEPVYAQLTVTSPRPDVAPYQDVLPIREYYTNRRSIPSRMLIGSHGALAIELKCSTVNQYLGMAEPDLFLLASQGRFETNFLRGLFGIWLQAMVLTAIGVCAGTFLSWPVALLMTFFFFIAGNVGFVALQKFALAAELVGGGPFESLIRMLSHDNLMTELAPTTAVVTAKTLDSIVMPVMARLVYLVPNFNALDVSNTVADGFAVPWSTIGAQLLLAVGYALPFSIAGYFILRNREVAA